MRRMKVSEVAKIFGKDPAWIRAGIIEGWLPIGYATRKGKLITDVNEINSKKGRINYYILEEKVNEYFNTVFNNGIFLSGTRNNSDS